MTAAIKNSVRLATSAMKPSDKRIDDGPARGWMEVRIVSLADLSQWSMNPVYAATKGGGAREVANVTAKR
jgi:hypothetical protein